MNRETFTDRLLDAYLLVALVAICTWVRLGQILGACCRLSCEACPCFAAYPHLCQKCPEYTACRPPACSPSDTPP